MHIHVIVDSFGDPFPGVWLDKRIAEKVEKIIQMCVDEGAELKSLEINQCVEQLKAGLLPYKIEITRSVASGEILTKDISLTWPPAESEGMVEEREDYVRYFAWAKTQNEAVQRAVLAKRPGSPQKGAVASW